MGICGGELNKLQTHSPICPESLWLFGREVAGQQKKEKELKSRVTVLLPIRRISEDGSVVNPCQSLSENYFSKRS